MGVSVTDVQKVGHDKMINHKDFEFLTVLEALNKNFSGTSLQSHY